MTKPLLSFNFKCHAHLSKCLDLPTITKVALFLKHGSNFGSLPFLTPQVTHMGISGNRTCVHLVSLILQVLSHRCSSWRE